VETPKNYFATFRVRYRSRAFTFLSPSFLLSFRETGDRARASTFLPTYELILVAFPRLFVLAPTRAQRRKFYILSGFWAERRARAYRNREKMIATKNGPHCPEVRLKVNRFRCFLTGLFCGLSGVFGLRLSGKAAPLGCLAARGIGKSQ